MNPRDLAPPTVAACQRCRSRYPGFVLGAAVAAVSLTPPQPVDSLAPPLSEQPQLSDTASVLLACAAICFVAAVALAVCWVGWAQ